MSILHSPLANKYVVGFGVSLMLLLLLGSCNSDDDNATASTVASTNEDLVGNWALIRVTGGFAGIDVNYTIENSPESLTFGSVGTNLVDVITDTSNVTISYSVQDVTSSNDTTFFTFSSIRSSPQNFYLSGYDMILVDDQTLQTKSPCCDYFDYRFAKL